jgi:hypothetical protein
VANLESDLNALRGARPRTFAQWLEVADSETKELVLGAIRDNAILPNPLAVMLTKKHGIPITRETIVALREES